MSLVTLLYDPTSISLSLSSFPPPPSFLCPFSRPLSLSLSIRKKIRKKERHKNRALGLPFVPQEKNTKDEEISTTSPLPAFPLRSYQLDRPWPVLTSCDLPLTLLIYCFSCDLLLMLQKGNSALRSTFISYPKDHLEAKFTLLSSH